MYDVADPDTLRARRYRAHRAGDHSLCKQPARCEAAGADAESLDLLSLATVLDEYPMAGMRAVALRLAELCDREPTNMAYVRELRGALGWLGNRSGILTREEITEYLRGLREVG